MLVGFEPLTSDFLDQSRWPRCSAPRPSSPSSARPSASAAATSSCSTRHRPTSTTSSTSVLLRWDLLQGQLCNSKLLTKQCYKVNSFDFFHYLFPNSALISEQQMALLRLLTTLCRGLIQTYISRVAPVWDLWRTIYQLSYRAVASFALLGMTQ